MGARFVLDAGVLISGPSGEPLVLLLLCCGMLEFSDPGSESVVIAGAGVVVVAATTGITTNTALLIFAGCAVGW